MRYSGCRSRKGAWIEIIERGADVMNEGRRSREGAWIEIRKDSSELYNRFVAPARERGLKYGTRLDFRFC